MGRPTLLSPSSQQLLNRGIGGVDVALGGLGIANAINDPHINDAQRAIRSARSLLGGVQGAGQMTGSYNISPYGDYAGAALNIADIIASDQYSSGEKAIEAAHQVGRTVADAYMPMGGMFADALKMAALDPIIYGNNHYMRTRLAEGGTLPRIAGAAFSLLGSATTPEELAGIIGVRSGNAQARIGPEIRDGRLAFGGHHLDTGNLDADLDAAYRQQAALISAANAGDPQALSLLAALRQENAIRDNALGTVLRSKVPNPGDTTPQDYITPQALFSFYSTPGSDTALETYGTLQDWIKGLDRLAQDYGPNSPEAQRSLLEIARLQSAADALGMDLNRAAEQMAENRQEEQRWQMNHAGGGDGPGDAGGM